MMVSSLFAQQRALVPVVVRAVYFDVSPPLRDMVRLIPGKVDRSWKDGVVQNVFDAGRTPEPLPAGVTDPGIQDNPGTILIDTVIQNFNGLGNTGSVPPDTYGEAGPLHYFQVVNSSYAIYNKNGGKILGPVANSTVWNGLPNNENSGDAVVLYDETADRWLFTQFSLPFYPSGPFFQMIAVSQTPDPTGSWYRYQYEFDVMPDYPKFGVWTDGYYMSSNNFGSGGYVGNGAYGYDRDAMLAGDPDAMQIAFELPGGSEGFITLYPSDCDGALPAAGTPNYFAYIKTGSPQYLGIYEFHADWSNPANATFGNKVTLNVNPFTSLGFGGGIPQMGTSVLLEAIGDRLMYRLQYRKFNGYQTMVVNHSVTASAGVAGVRWYELRQTTGAWSIYQQSTYAPDGHSRWMGSIAMDTAGSIALGYSVSSSTLYPSIRVTGRLKTDPLNVMTMAEKIIMAGGGSQTGSWSGRSRWGDYSGMSVDPANPTTFWYTTEYYASTGTSNWLTRIGSFSFGNVFSTNVSAMPPHICQGSESQLSSVAYGGSGSYTYAWTSIPPGFTSGLKNPVVTPMDTTVYIVATSDGITTRHDTVQVKVNPAPTAFAGNDTTVCHYVAEIELHGEAAHYNMVGWGSSGDGTFSDLTGLNTIYHPGQDDLETGYADLLLMAFPLKPCNVKATSTMRIVFDPCTGIDESAPEVLQMVIRPNPAKEDATVVVSGLAGQQAALLITDMEGKVWYSGSVGGAGKQVTTRLDLAGYASGVYIVHLKTMTGSATERLVVL
jgi:hypothetical protein